MAKINVLDFEIANLIAAGEVVERPSSVLKELIENSIDSGATEIVAEIKRGGVALIRVTDNGCGIDKEDLPIALKRHATSKIRGKEDLDTIATLGFRGEALAAISSVSDMTIITKTAAADTAYMLTAEAGRVTDICEVGAAEGTTVVVENLFYNVPARRKFLKKDSTEAMNVSALVEKVALSSPNISVQLLVDGEQRFKTKGDGDILNTVYAVFGKEFSEKLIKCDGTANGIRVHGYIGRSDNVRKNRNLENIFINGRYVKSLTAMAAVEKAYTSYIAPECFPSCVLFIEMKTSEVDVNVHPAKLEVKFSDERAVFEAVYYTVKDALESSVYRPEISLDAKKSFYNPAAAFVPIGRGSEGSQLSFGKADTPSAPKTEYRPANFSFPSPKSTERVGRYEEADRSIKVTSGLNPRSAEASGGSYMSPRESLDLLKAYGKAAPSEINTPASPTPAVADEKSPEIKDCKIIGEAFDVYVMVECGEELLVIDKHAAHERVIFEELKAAYAKDGRVASQSLLLPIGVILGKDEIAAVTEAAEDFRAVGFEFIRNGYSVDITAIPDAISAEGAERLFTEMAGELLSGRGNPKLTEEIRREKALYQIACKAAIKGGRSYTPEIIRWLVEKLLSLPDVIVCPHGRPVAYKLTRRELDRQFDRIK